MVFCLLVSKKQHTHTHTSTRTRTRVHPHPPPPQPPRSLQSQRRPQPGPKGGVRQGGAAAEQGGEARGGDGHDREHGSETRRKRNVPRIFDFLLSRGWLRVQAAMNCSMG